MKFALLIHKRKRSANSLKYSQKILNRDFLLRITFKCYKYHLTCMLCYVSRSHVAVVLRWLTQKLSVSFTLKMTMNKLCVATCGQFYTLFVPLLRSNASQLVIRLSQWNVILILVGSIISIYRLVSNHTNFL